MRRRKPQRTHYKSAHCREARSLCGQSTTASFVSRDPRGPKLKAQKLTPTPERVDCQQCLKLMRPWSRA